MVSFAIYVVYGSLFIAGLLVINLIRLHNRATNQEMAAFHRHAEALSHQCERMSQYYRHRN